MFFFSKDRQKSALKKAIINADKLMAQEMDRMSLDIQRTALNPTLSGSLPKIVLGQHGAGTLEGNDGGYQASIHLDCPNKDRNDTVVTCNGRGHSISGNGVDHLNGSFEIRQGNWSPAGFSYWVETPEQGKDIRFVMIHWAETSEATVTVINKKGKTKRTMRTMKLVLEKNETVPLCPSVKTVIQKSGR